jgi:hypothetical protein
MRGLLSRVALGLTVLLLVSADVSAQGRQGGPPPRQRQTPEGQRLGKAGRAAFERAARHQDQIRDLTARLKRELLELNKLRHLPPSEASSPAVAKEIEARKAAILKLSATIYALMSGDGLADAILSERPALERFQANGLPPSEQQELEDAGFTDDEIAELNITVRMESKARLETLKAGDQVDKLKSADRSMSVKNVAQIAAGTLLIGTDIGSRWIPGLNAVTAQAAITSVANGMVLVATGFDKAK